MKDRILQFLESEKISPAEFADKIGVQRSSMSHILNGRNYPSASFIQKMLAGHIHFWTPDGLMIGVGSMSAEPGNLTQKFQSDSTVPLLISEAVVPDSSGSQAKVQAETGTELPFSTKRGHRKTSTSGIM